ncbi:MAG: SDR family oxidoreductase [Desulfovibrionaceae bacterium]
MYRRISSITKKSYTRGVGDAATFLASDLARGVIGEILHVDGGYAIITL